MIDYLLSDHELAELKLAHKLCKKRKEADRLKTVYLLGKGWSVQRVAEALLLEDDSIRRYFQLYKEKGLQALIDGRHMGRMSYLTDAEFRLLESHLMEHTYQSIGEIVEYVEEEFDAEYTESGMRYVLYHLGFVYKKPEKIPFRVDEGKQKAFIRKYREIRKKIKETDGLYFMDATHPEHRAIPGYGWIKKGEKKVLKSNPIPYRLNINGAINIDTLDMVVRFEERMNKETTMDFFELLRKHQPDGWIYLICDNAGYYQSPEVKLYAKHLAIKLIYLPPYSPNLNLIERVWKFFKKKILYNKYYETFSDMVDSSRKFFRQIDEYKDDLRSILSEKFQIIRS